MIKLSGSRMALPGIAVRLFIINDGTDPWRHLVMAGTVAESGYFGHG